MADIRVGRPSDGEVLRLRPGDRLVLELPENPTTGYRWAVTDLDAPLELVDDRNTDVDPTPGAASTRVLVFATTAAGEGALRLRKAQAWEPERADAEHVGCRVVVED